MKQYNIRLDAHQVMLLDAMDGSRSKHIRDAIDLYLRGDMSAVGVVNASDMPLRDEFVQDLKDQRDYFKHKCEYYELGWFRRLFYSKKQLLLPAKDAEFKVHG